MDKRDPAHPGLGIIKLPAHEQEAEDGGCTDDKPSCCRYGDKEQQPEPELERLLESLDIPFCGLPAHGGKYRLSYGHRKDPLGELEKPLCIVEIGDTTLREE